VRELKAFSLQVEASYIRWRTEYTGGERRYLKE